MYRLVFQSGRYQGKRLMVRQALTLVGSHAECHLVLADDPALAARHARFEARGSGVYLSSLSPDHPVLLDDRPVLQETRLVHGARLQLGHTLIQFQDVIAPHKRLRPSRGLLQPMTTLLATGIVIGELAWLLFLVDWPKRIIHPETEAEDKARVEEVRAALAAARQAETGTVSAASSGSVAVLPGTAPAAASPAATNVDGTAAPALPPTSVQVLNQADFTPADTNVVLIAPPPVVAADPVIEAAKRTLAEAVAAAQFADYARATRLLNQIHQNARGFLPAHVEHARLLEARGNVEEAKQRWTLILGIAPEGSPYRSQAIKERQRLSQLQKAQSQVLQTPASPGRTPPPQQIRIQSPQLQKLPSDADVAEMRVLDATLELAADAKSFKDASIQVFVTFYDVDQNDAVRPTRAIVPASPIPLGKAFADRRNAPLHATYVVPKDMRARELRETGRQTEYYGYTIHLYAGQTLQDAVAKPQKLLALPIYVPTSANEP